MNEFKCACVCVSSVEQMYYAMKRTEYKETAAILAISRQSGRRDRLHQIEKCENVCLFDCVAYTVRMTNWLTLMNAILRFCSLFIIRLPHANHILVFDFVIHREYMCFYFVRMSNPLSIRLKIKRV